MGILGEGDRPVSVALSGDGLVEISQDGCTVSLSVTEIVAGQRVRRELSQLASSIVEDWRSYREARERFEETSAECDAEMAQCIMISAIDHMAGIFFGYADFDAVFGIELEIISAIRRAMVGGDHILLTKSLPTMAYDPLDHHARWKIIATCVVEQMVQRGVNEHDAARIAADVLTDRNYRPRKGGKRVAETTVKEWVAQALPSRSTEFAVMVADYRPEITKEFQEMLGNNMTDIDHIKEVGRALLLARLRRH